MRPFNTDHERQVLRVLSMCAEHGEDVFTAEAQRCVAALETIDAEGALSAEDMEDMNRIYTALELGPR